MTQPLRTVHRRAIFVLALALPALFIAGLAARPPAIGNNPGIAWGTLFGNVP
jgi:hypothetical protein